MTEIKLENLVKVAKEEVPAGAKQPRFQLEQAFGAIRVTARNDGVLYLDGEEQGRIPSGRAATINDVVAGRHSLEFRYDDGTKATRSVTVTQNRTVRIDF